MVLDPKAKLTPNLKALLIEIMANVAVEEAKKQYGSAGVGEMAEQIQNMPAHAKVAKQRLEQYLTAMENAKDSPSRDPEVLAGLILARLKEKKTCGK